MVNDWLRGRIIENFGFAPELESPSKVFRYNNWEIESDKHIIVFSNFSSRPCFFATLEENVFY